MNYNYGFPGVQRLPWRSVRGRWAPPRIELNAARITLVYLVLGIGALVVSDVLIVGPLSDPILAQVQALKGTVEVLLTGGLLFALTRTRERQVEQTTSTLEQQRDELQLLHRVVRHNLRNDLNVLYGSLDLLNNEASTVEPGDLHRTVSEKFTEMEANLDRLRRIRQVTKSNPASVTVTLPDAIYSVLETHAAITGDIEVSVSCPDDIAIECNPMLQEGIDELITNAVRHSTAENPRVDIEVAPEDGPAGMVAIHITDNGPGLPSMELEAIQARQNGERSQMVHSTGLGIWFVHWMITHSGGRFQVDVTEPSGTRITLCLPYAEAQSHR